MAVKLSNANFILRAAANPARQVRSIARRLFHLETAIDAALEALAKDAADGFLHPLPHTMGDEDLVYVSTSTVIKCEEACNVIGELEILLSRVLSLLQELPGKYNLVDTLLQCRDGQFVFIKHASERSAFLHRINAHSSSPESAVREYVLHNADSSNPCQLSVRLVPDSEETQSASLYHGSLLLALTKTSRSWMDVS